MASEIERLRDELARESAARAAAEARVAEAEKALEEAHRELRRNVAAFKEAALLPFIGDAAAEEGGER